MIYHIVVISWDMQILQELLSTVHQINLLLFTDTFMFGLENIIIISPYNTITIQVLYYFKNTLKVLFIIKTLSTWFHVDLILQPLHSVIQKFSHIKLSYIPLEIKLVLIYWMMKTLQYLISLIQSQIHQPFINSQHRKKNVWIIDINGEEPIIAQGVVDEINCYQTTCVKSKAKISLRIIKIYQRKYLEEILSRFYQVRPVVSQNKFSHQITLVKF